MAVDIKPYKHNVVSQKKGQIVVTDSINMIADGMDYLDAV